MLCDALPRAPLAYLPTPLEELPRLSAAVGGPRVFIKRDDRSGLSFGGNKPRIFEYVFGDALAQGCDLMITPAGVQSNHLREVTAAANKLGLRSVIVVCGGTGKEEPQGNLLLFRLLGAEIRYFEEANSRSPALFRLLDEIEAEKEAQGHKPYIVHFRTRSGVLGSLAHVQAAEELATQFREQGVAPDYLFVPAGSGVTLSGFVLGLKHLGVPTRVVGIGLIRPRRDVAPEVVEYGNNAAAELGLPTRISEADFDLHDEYIGPGHGVLTPGVVEAIRLTAGNEGIFLDPTYNGKAMAALIDMARTGKLTARHTVVLVHSGGVPALFAQHRILAGE